MVGMPNGRIFPFAFGIYTRFTLLRLIPPLFHLKLELGKIAFESTLLNCFAGL